MPCSWQNESNCVLVMSEKCLASKPVLAQRRTWCLSRFEVFYPCTTLLYGETWTRETKVRKMWAIKQSSSTSYKLSYVTSRSNHAHSHTARITRVTRPQSVGFTLVLSFYKVVNPWTFLSFAKELCQTQTSSKIFKGFTRKNHVCQTVVTKKQHETTESNEKKFHFEAKSVVSKTTFKSLWSLPRTFWDTCWYVKNFISDFFASLLLKKQGYFRLFRTFGGGKYKKSNFYSQTGKFTGKDLAKLDELLWKSRNHLQILLYSIIFQMESMTNL